MSVIYSVPQGHCVLVERFGRFSRVQYPGLRFKIPFVESIRRLDVSGSDWGPVANKGGWLLELGEQQTNTAPRACHTKDNVEVTADASVYWRVVDPRRAVYDVDNLPESVSDLALNALRSRIGTLDLDTILSERARLNQSLVSDLSPSGEKWGLLYTRVEIRELLVNEDTARAMRQQMEAERKRRAVVAEAEGAAAAELKLAEAQRNAAVLRAQGEAQAIALRAEAEAAYLARLQQVTTPEHAAQILISQKYIDGFDAISKNEADKVYLPASFRGLLNIDDTAH